jgi:hypothetical protein
MYGLWIKIQIKILIKHKNLKIDDKQHYITINCKLRTAATRHTVQTCLLSGM